jgi:hypothetical protein
MCGFETRFRADEDADRIMSTFYAFVEQHGQEVDGDAHLRRDFDGREANVLVRLWSAEAMDAFLGALAVSVHPPRKSVYE